MSAPGPRGPTPPRPRPRANPFISETFRHRETPSFFRARWRNAGVALGLLAFVGGVFKYTVSSVSRDDFSEFDSDGIRRVDFEDSKVKT